MCVCAVVSLRVRCTCNDIKSSHRELLLMLDMLNTENVSLLLFLCREYAACDM